MNVTSDFKKLVKLLVSINSEEEMENLLVGLFTPKEREELPIRIQIIKMLKQGIPQHQIAEELGVGVATVTRGSKEIKQGTFKVIK
jgi:TrpR family trp operon transcriptional repressor